MEESRRSTQMPGTNWFSPVGTKSLETGAKVPKSRFASHMRRFGSRVGFAFLASTAIAAPLFTTTTTTTADAPVDAEYRMVLEGKPTNAAKIFRWGLSTWEDEFIPDRLPARWKSNSPGQVGAQIGMLTLKAGPGTQSLWTAPDDIKRRYGRWEARVRVKDPSPKTRYAMHKAFFELIPSGDYRCGARNLTIASYTPRVDQVVRGSVRNDGGGHQFNFSRDPKASTEEFHTFAVEIARNHITWFVDKVPVATERRPEALNLGYYYKPRFRLAATGGKMDETWLQMDWIRFYNLKRENARSIAAPPMEKGYNAASKCY
jgi:hypothetical protein